jgi:hypothetical protein
LWRELDFPVSPLYKGGKNAIKITANDFSNILLGVLNYLFLTPHS